MPPQVNIDNLTTLAHERNDEAAWRSLWSAVLALPAWYAVGDDQRPDAPVVLMLRDQPTVVVFTDEPKARRFISAGVAQSASTLIPMRLPRAVGFLAQLAARGVTQVLFNPGRTTNGFGYGLAAFSTLAAAFGVIDPSAPPPPPPVPTGDPRLDALVAAFAADPGEEANLALFRYLYDLPAWHLIATGEPPDARPLISMFNSAPVLLAFTSEPLARAYAQARSVSGQQRDAGPVTALSLPVERVIAAAENAMGLAGIVFNDGSQSFFAPTRNLRPMLEHFRPPTPPDAD